MIDTELKPCPLCDCDVSIHDFAGWEILCDCGINFAPDFPLSNSREETIKAWNTRVDTNEPKGEK